MSDYIGDFLVDDIVIGTFDLNDSLGGAVAPSAPLVAADFKIYKGASSLRGSVVGLTVAAVAGLTGQYALSLDLEDNTDPGFYVGGADYRVVLVPPIKTVDGQAVVSTVMRFSVQNRPLSAAQMNAIADAHLKRDWTLVTGIIPARCAFQALRGLRNAWFIDEDGVYHVTEEDDVTEAWTQQLTATPGADPVTGAE